MHGKTLFRTVGSTRHRRSRGIVLLGTMFALVLCGCSFSLVDLAPHSQSVRRFELPAPELTPVKIAWCRSLVLAVDPFTTPDKYDTRFYSVIGRHEVLALDTAQWVEPPGLMVADLLHAGLLQCHVFRHVTTARSGVAADLRLTGSVLVFEKQRGGKHAPDQAVLRISVALVADRPLPAPVRERLAAGETGNETISPSLVWETILEAREPVKDSSPEAFATAMGACLQQVSSDLVLKITELAPGSGSSQKAATTGKTE